MNEKREKLKISINEDNEVHVNNIKQIVLQVLSELKISEDEFEIDIYKSAEDNIASGKMYQINILDIKLDGEMTGLQLGGLLKERSTNSSRSIVLTSSIDRGEESSDIEARYVTKQSMKKKLPKVLSQEIEKVYPIGFLEVKVNREIVRIFYNSIRMMQRCGSSVGIYLANGEVISVYGVSLECLKSKLPGDNFMTPHQNNVINMDYVGDISIEDKQIALKYATKNEVVMIVKRHFKEVYSQIQDYKYKKIRSEMF